MKTGSSLTQLFSLLLTLSALFFSFGAKADRVLLLSEQDARYRFSDYVTIYPDSTASLSVSDITSQDFSPLPGTSSYGHVSHPVWSKIEIKNDTSQSRWYLQHLFPLTKELSLFVEDSQGSFVKETLSLNDPLDKRKVPESLMTFRLDIEPGEQQVIYLKHVSPTLISYQFKIFSDSELIVSERNHSFYQAFFYAFLLIIAIINVLLASSSGRKRYLYVFLFCIGQMIGYSIYEGVFEALTGIQLGDYRVTILILAAGSAFIALVYYLRFIMPSLTEVKTLKLVTGAVLFYWSVLPFVSLLPSLFPYRLFVISFVATSIFMIWPTLVGVIRQDFKSWHLPASLMIFSGAFMLQGAHRLGFVEDFHGVSESVRVGIVTLSFSMTLTMMEYVRSLKSQIASTNVKFRKVFNAMQDAMAILDKDFKVLEVNQTALALEGVSLDQLIGRSVLEDSLIAKRIDSREKLREALETAKAGKQSQIEIQTSFADSEMARVFNISVIPYQMEGEDNLHILLSGRDLTESQQHQARMAAISAVLSQNTGDKFFEALASKLVEISGMELAIIASLDLDRHEANTHAVYMDGEIRENFSYPLAGTPCNELLTKSICVYQDNVAELFPDDQFLIDASIRSYTGTILRSSSGEPLGLIALLSRESTQGTNLEELISIFSLRAAAEMERLSSLQSLIETEQKLSLHIGHTPLGVVEIDNDNVIVEWNKAAQKIFGYTREEVIGRDANETIFNTLSAQEFGMLLLSGRKQGSNVFSHERKDASSIYCEWFVTPLIDKNQELGYAAMFEDVTLQKRTLSALIRKEQEQSDILNSMADAAITIDEKGRVLSFNQAAIKTFEYTEDEILGRSIDLLMPDDISSKYKAYLEQYLATGEPEISGVGREVEGLSKSGREFPMRLSISELPSSEMGGRRFIGTCHDLTSLKQKEQQLLQSQKMESLGKLTGGIAHDFNNILGVITGYTGLLSATAELDDSEIGYLDEINHAANRGSTLTKKLLSMSKAKPMESSTVNLDQAVEGMKDVIKRTMTPRVNVNIHLDSASGVIRVDLNSFEDTLLNLCINAMHAMQSEGELSISTRADVVVSDSQASGSGLSGGLYHVLSVRDSGEGIDKSILNKVFDPFFSTKGEKGTGLGLSQAYGFMKQSEGFIELDSLVGVGTEFRLYFPSLNQETLTHTENARQDELTEYRGTEKVLVVDDEIHLQKTTAALLEHSGYQVTTTGQAKQAIELAEEGEFDFVLSDVVMPEMDGYELAERLQELKPSTNIQLMSGYLSEAIKQKVSQRGLKILVKPFTHKELVRFVRTSIDNAEQTDTDIL